MPYYEFKICPKSYGHSCDCSKPNLQLTCINKFSRPTPAYMIRAMQDFNRACHPTNPMIINILKNYNELKLEELLAEPRQGLSGARSYLAEEVCSLDEGC